jgi:hypothetical protein
VNNFEKITSGMEANEVKYTLLPVIGLKPKMSS